MPQLKYWRQNHQGEVYADLRGLSGCDLFASGRFLPTAASLGTAFTSQHAGILKRYTDQVILTYDSDGAGVKAALRAIPILREAGLSARILNMSPCKDPDEFIKQMGPDAFRKRILEAKNSFLFEIDVLKRQYALDDPEQKTKFYQETARKLLQFGEPLERDNYLQAVAREHMIKEDELRQLVKRNNCLSKGRLPRGRGAARRETAPDEGASFKGASEGRTGNGDGTKSRRRPEREDGIRRSQRLLLTWLIEDPALFDKIRGVITADDFVEELYHQVAVMVFEGHEQGSLIRLRSSAVLSMMTISTGRWRLFLTPA